MRSRRSLPVELLTVVAAAAVATQVKTWAEAALQPLAEKALPPAPTEKTRLGADPGDHPEKMPPAELADRAGQAAGAEPLSDDQRQTSSQVLHWVMGMGSGTLYGLLAHRLPPVRAGRGTLFGAALFGATHGSLLPAVGAQASLFSLPRAWWVWEPGSHVVYGAALDFALTGLDAAVENAWG